MPRVSYADIEKGLSTEQVQEIKKRGVVIVKGGVPKEVRQRAHPSLHPSPDSVRRKHLNGSDPLTTTLR